MSQIAVSKPRPLNTLQWRMTLLFSLALVASFLALQVLLFVGLYTAALSQTAGESAREALAQHARDRRGAVLAGDAAALRLWIDQQRAPSPPVWTFAPPEFTDIEATVDFGRADTLLMVTDGDGQVLAWSEADAAPGGPIHRTERMPIGLRNEMLSAIVTPETPVRLKTDASGMTIVIARIEDDAQTLKGLLVLRARVIEPWSAIRSGVRYYFAGNGGGYTCINAQIAFPLGILLSYLVARSVTRRIDKIERASERWSGSDFSARVDDQGADEIGMVAARLNDMAGQMSQLLLERQERAALEERTRIMQDLHDSAKQQALAVSGRLATARVLIDKDVVKTKALLLETERMHDLLKRELTALITGSPPPLLADKGIAEAVREHARNWSAQTGIHATVHAESDLDLPLDLSHALFRIVQEALANVEKHSGANQVDIVFRCCSDPVLQVQDNGRGFDTSAPAAGFGLFSMRERVRKIGGTIELTSSPGAGTTLTVRKWSTMAPGATA